MRENKFKEVVLPVDQELAHTIEQTIREKIYDLRADRYNPWCIILNEEAYITLCYALEKRGVYLYPSTGALDIRYYEDVLVVLDMDTSDDIKVLARPYEELAYPINHRGLDNE